MSFYIDFVLGLLVVMVLLFLGNSIDNLHNRHASEIKDLEARVSALEVTHHKTNE